MSRVFRDTNLFVYLVEDRGERAERVLTLRRRMIERDDEVNARFNPSSPDSRSHSTSRPATRSRSAGPRLCSSPSTAPIRFPAGKSSVPSCRSSTTR